MLYVVTRKILIGHRGSRSQGSKRTGTKSVVVWLLCIWAVWFEIGYEEVLSADSGTRRNLR